VRSSVDESIVDERTTGLGRTWREMAPFAATALLAWVVAPVGSSVDWWQYAVSCALALLSGVIGLATLLGYQRLPRSTVPSALAFLAAVAVLRESVGGSPAGVAGLSVIPVFYTALHGRSRRELGLVLCGQAAVYLAPILVVGPPAYPHTLYRAALVSVAVSSIIGLAIQRLVADVRRQAGEARFRGRMLEQVSDTVHTLFDSPEPRRDVCEAAKTISNAAIVSLYEPIADSDVLSCTASTRLDAVAQVTAKRQSAVYEVFRSGQSRLVAGPELRVNGIEASTHAGRTASILYQPLVKDDVTKAVLVLGWEEDVGAEEPRATVVALLAHKAAAVIDLADAIDSLTDEAQTDPLTGLPNRRIWDARLKGPLVQQRQIAIAMLDFDRFKAFNDAHGHPAGDRLLKETAAVWRTQLRGDDLLVRLGGEEFGLLLFDCDTASAVETVERLRQNVPANQTCSAGIARRHCPGCDCTCRPGPLPSKIRRPRPDPPEPAGTVRTTRRGTAHEPRRRVLDARCA
jgi:diguanylate cyclase (GGDEF)-like protein